MSRHRHRFFVAQPLLVGDTLTLDEHQSRQLTKVLRMRIGDRIGLFNGDGQEYDAAIVDTDRRGATVVVDRSVPGVELPGPAIHLALAMIKSDRFEWALQKATELGVERIIPMTAESSVISLRVDREAHRQQRWARIVVEASEQSGRCTVPDVTQVTSFVDVIRSAESVQAVVLWEDETATPLTSLALDPHRPVLLIVGSEGGYARSEVELARDAGAKTATLGRLTLRSETAAVAAVAMLVGQALSRPS